MKIFPRLNIQLPNLNYMMIQQIKYILQLLISDYISDSNYVFMNNTFFYNFESDTINLKLVVSFRMTEVVKIWYESVNTDRMIIKHYRS